MRYILNNCSRQSAALRRGALGGLLLAALALPTLGAAEPPAAAVTALQRAAVRVEHRGHGGGSGVLIDERRALTCEHLFRGDDGRPEVGPIVLRTVAGAATTGRLLAVDRVWDLALVELAAPLDDAQPLPWSSTAPPPGAKALSAGFGAAGRLAVNVGEVRGYTFAKGRHDGPRDTLIVSGAARSGDSGGPIVDADGRLLGVLWGTDGVRVVGTQLGRCQQFAQPYCNPAGRTPAPLEPPPTLLAELAQLRVRLQALEDQFARAAPQAGPPGEPGPRGPPGPPGPAASVDLDRLTLEVRRRLAGSIQVRVEPTAPRR